MPDQINLPMEFSPLNMSPGGRSTAIAARMQMVIFELITRTSKVNLFASTAMGRENR